MINNIPVIFVKYMFSQDKTFSWYTLKFRYLGIKATFILILVQIIFNSFTYGQDEIRFERLTRTDGLSHNNVTSIIQDRYGFMWFGTQDGLNRFDGFNFKNFYNEPSLANSISSNHITFIYQCIQGNLWIGTDNNGLENYNPLTNEFTHYVYDENNRKTLSSNHIKAIIEDKSGNLWIATADGGLNFFNVQSEEFTRIMLNPKYCSSISSNEVHSIELDRSGNLWIGTSSNLDYYNLKTKEFTHYVIGYESFDQTKQLSVDVLLLDKNNLLWIGTSNGLFTFNQNKNEIIEFKQVLNDPSSISSEKINSIYEDSYGSIWIGTENGLNRFIPQTRGFEKHYVDPTNTNSLSNNCIKHIFEDRSNILWIGTKGGGVNKIDLKRKKFYSLNYQPVGQKGLPAHNVTSIVGDTGDNIWIGTDGGGACRFNKKTSDIQYYKHNKVGKNVLSDEQINAVLTGKGKIWFGMNTGGLNAVEEVKNSFQVEVFTKSNDSTGISNNQVNCLMYDKDGFLWVGTRDGLNKMIDTSSNGKPYFLNYTNDFWDTNSISSNNISAIYQDHKGFIWIGTKNNGLNRLDQRNGKIDRFFNRPDDPNSIGSNIIFSIFEDHMGMLWIGTGGGGLNKLNPANGLFTRYTVNDGLAGNQVVSILEDNSGFLWIGTTKGLSRFDPSEKLFTNFDINDGLINDGFNPSAAYKDYSGWMYFGTPSGLIYFHPSEIQPNPYKPEIVITKFTFLRQNEWTSNDLFISKYNQEQSSIVLTYDKNIFSVEFAALDFTNPLENQYQYKIEGINDQWIDYGNKRYIMVSNLSPGKYILRIRGSNNDGIYNGEGIAVPIIIKPPFWRTIWFYLIVAFIVIIIALSIYSYLIKLKTNKILALKNNELQLANQLLVNSEKSLKELNNTKDKFFSIIAHDLRNPFNPLLALTELLDSDYKELDEKERIGYIKEIRLGAKKLNDLLENLLSWALSQTRQIKFNPASIDITEIIENNIELLRINTEKKNITLVENLNGEFMVFADENMLNSTIRNLLNNAIKFAPENSVVEILIEDEGEFCRIEVKDQGPGIAPENRDNIFSGISSPNISKIKGKGSGLGLILCKEFVDKNGGKIWVESVQGKGSSFFFTIPKAKED